MSSKFFGAGSWGSFLPLAGGVLPDPDTFEMARVYTLFPALATGYNGSWSWYAQPYFFGGYFYQWPGAVTDYCEWENLVMSAGTWSIRVLCTETDFSGIASVYFDGVDTGVNIDMYAASALQVVRSDTFTVASKTRGTLRLLMESKNASSSAYSLTSPQIALVKTSAGGDTGASLDDLPWHNDAPAVSWSSASGTPALSHATSNLLHSRVAAHAAQNDWIEYEVWLAAGTYSMTMIATTDADHGILTIAVNGSTVGTQDHYSASTSTTAKVTTTGMTVSTTGKHTIRLTTATKNASSTGYKSSLGYMHWRRTA